MRIKHVALIPLFCFALIPLSRAEDLVQRVRNAVQLGTLDQAGTRPFHLKAALAPSFVRDNDSGRTGEVEIWWTSPDHWRREVRCPGFHQIQVVDGAHAWQKNEGDYFPEWLRETAVALVNPLILSDDVLHLIHDAEVRHMAGTTYMSWTLMSSNGEVSKGMGAGVSITDATGLLFTADGFGWGGLFRDYRAFHGRKVAQTVSTGSPEVTAKVVILEDLGQMPPGFFDASAAGSDPQALQTVLLSEGTFRQNLLPAQPLSWPPLKDGPLEGVLTTKVSVDRSGQIREIGGFVSDNPGVEEAARTQVAAMRLKPFTLNGVAVQAVSRLTLSFKTTRPVGAETFESAHTWFERGRRAGFPAAGAGEPYILRADFQTRGSSGAVATGHYEDTWMSASQWRREATFESSRYVRARSGERTYQLADGPEARLAALVFQLIEPIPAMDTFVESDWRIKSDTVSGVKTVRILSGYESPEGKLDPEHARGFWFDETGSLIRTFVGGLETRRSNFQSFGTTKIAGSIDVLKDDHLALQIRVLSISPAGDLPRSTFELKGHEWTRSFTAEER